MIARSVDARVTLTCPSRVTPSPPGTGMINSDTRISDGPALGFTSIFERLKATLVPALNPGNLGVAVNVALPFALIDQVVEPAGAAVMVPPLKVNALLPWVGTTKVRLLQSRFLPVALVTVIV